MRGQLRTPLPICEVSCIVLSIDFLLQSHDVWMVAMIAVKRLAALGDSRSTVSKLLSHAEKVLRGTEALNKTKQNLPQVLLFSSWRHCALLIGQDHVFPSQDVVSLGLATFKTLVVHFMLRKVTLLQKHFS